MQSNIISEEIFTKLDNKTVQLLKRTKQMKGVNFVSGIDTDTTKNVETGMLTKECLQQGKRMLHTKARANQLPNIADDIAVHRKVMGIPMQEADKQRLTMPEIFSYPASPHLAARLDGRALDLTKSAPPHKNWRRSTKSFWSKRGRIDGSADGKPVNH